MIWNTLSSRVASRPATAMISIRASQPAIHSAALVFEGVRSIGCDENKRVEEGTAVSATASAICNGQICRCCDAHLISLWERLLDWC